MTVTMIHSPRPGGAATGFRVASLVVYPVKSARGIPLAEAEVGRRGIAHDRRFMIVDAAGRFVSQREHPKLALLPTSIASDVVTLGGVRLPRAPAGPTRRVSLWKDEVDAVEVGGDVDAMLREYLGAEVSLVHLPDAVVRPVDPAYGHPGDETTFADGYPLLILGQASLDDLNARLERPVPMNRFRPNIVIAGSPAFAEDGWSSVMVGSLSVRVVKPCARCSIPTIDQDTAEKGAEPSRALAKYRRVENEIMFGQNAIADGVATVHVGDSVIPGG